MERRTVYQSVPVLEWRSTDEIVCAIAMRCGDNPDPRNYAANIRAHLRRLHREGRIDRTTTNAPPGGAYWRRKP